MRITGDLLVFFAPILLAAVWAADTKTRELLGQADGLKTRINDLINSYDTDYSDPTKMDEIKENTMQEAINYIEMFLELIKDGASQQNGATITNTEWISTFRKMLAEDGGIKKFIKLIDTICGFEASKKIIKDLGNLDAFIEKTWRADPNNHFRKVLCNQKYFPTFFNTIVRTTDFQTTPPL